MTGWGRERFQAEKTAWRQMGELEAGVGSLGNGGKAGGWG